MNDTTSLTNSNGAERNLDEFLSQAAVRNGSQQSDGSRTPTASQVQLNNNEATSTFNGNPAQMTGTDASHYSHTTRDPALTRPSRTPSISSSTLAPSTYAPSTLNSYAPSSTVENTSLLPRPRHWHASVQPQLKKTKGRKAFVGLCDAIDFIVPVDVNDEATSMRESSLGKMAQAVQEMTQKRRNGGMVRRNESNGEARTGGIRVES